MVLAVDFNGTLAIGNSPHIAQLAPNRELIARLKAIREEISPEIKIVTALGAKDGILTDEQKARKYSGPIKAWLSKYGVPYDHISFKKEYANLYIDDQTITPHSGFHGISSTFTGNPVILTETMAIKNAETAPFEGEWYKEAKVRGFDVPEVLFYNSDCIITRRICDYEKPTAADFLPILRRFREIPTAGNFQTYIDNLPGPIENQTPDVSRIVAELPQYAHAATFFHGDLSTTNVLCCGYEGKPPTYLIDPNVKHIFGSYLTDAGKAAFSLIAYEAQYPEAEKIAAEFGPDVWRFAVAEGLRVCKYQPKYISIVNNIADFIADGQ